MFLDFGLINYKRLFLISNIFSASGKYKPTVLQGRPLYIA